MSDTVCVDFDDLCDDHDPRNDLEDLKSKYPGLRVTLFAIPNRCSDDLLADYGALEWVRLGVHGYHHSSMECATWGYEEAKAKLQEIESWWPGEKLFKAPGWVGNPELYRALRDLGWKVADNGLHAAAFGDARVERYIYNLEDSVKSVHGHTWNCMENGPDDWFRMMEGIDKDAEFVFVSDVCRVWDVDPVQETRNSWSHNSEFGKRSVERMVEFLETKKPAGKVGDFGGNDGTAARSAAHMGYDVEVVDISLSRVSFARHDLVAHLAPIEDTGLPDNYFQWGFSSHTLEHVKDLDAAIREMRRVCEKGFWVVVPLQSDESFKADDAHHQHLTEEEWLERFGGEKIWSTDQELAFVVEL